MQTGNETWKWVLVFVLLTVFIITANQAYLYISKLEDHPPPDDYLLGNSWELEQSKGPGAGQPVSNKVSDPACPDKAQQTTTNIEIIEDADWDTIAEEDNPLNKLVTDE